MKMKKLSYFQLYRPELDRITRDLDEREVVAYLKLVSSAGWDPRHAAHYAKVNKTIREINEDLLPNWSLGKVFNAIETLEKLEFIEKAGKRSWRINYIWIYTAHRKVVEKILSNPEHFNHLPKQIFQESEHSVRTGEQLNLRKQLNNLAESKRLPRGP